MLRTPRWRNNFGSSSNQVPLRWNNPTNGRASILTKDGVTKASKTSEEETSSEDVDKRLTTKMP
jgi:hypothetical protein